MVSSENMYSNEKFQLDLIDKVSYEFKDSLTSIIGFSEIIKNNCNNEENIHFINNVLTSSEQMLTFINSISAFSLFVSDNYQKNLHHFSLKELSFEIMSSFDAIIKKKKIKIQANMSDFKIKNDHKIFTQVLHNIFNHIIRITPQNGVIFINIYKFKNKIYYEIKTDSIISLPDEEKNENLIDLAQFQENLCANMDLFFVRKLLTLINSKLLLEKDNNDFASIKFCITDF